MKILMIGVDASQYGSPMSMTILARELKAIGHDVICVIPAKGKITEVLEEHGLSYEIVRIKKWIHPAQSVIKLCVMRAYRAISNFCSEIRLFAICLKNEIEIIHINSSATSCGYWCSKLLKLKLVWHIREFVEEDFDCRFYNKAKVIKRFQEADALIAVSKAIYNKYIRYVQNEKLTIVYNGIDEERFLSIKEDLFEERVPIIAHIGRIDENKGQKEFIEACVQCLQKNKNLEFETWIVGDGKKEYVEELEHMARGLKNRYSYKGFCNHIEKILSQVDIVVVNSKCEAFGRVTVEAMLSGRLVIGTNSGGTTELLDDNCGLLYNYGSSNELADKMQYALSHTEEMKAIALKGRKRAKELYTAKENANRINNIYMDIVKE